MDLPIRFPSDTQVILEEVERFRSLSPRERVRLIRNLFAEGEYLKSISPKAAWMEEDCQEQERLKHRSIKEFIARHAP